MLPIRTISVRQSLDVIKDETGGAVLVTDQCITEPESLSGEIYSCFQKVVNQLKLNGYTKYTWSVYYRYTCERVAAGQIG